MFYTPGSVQTGKSNIIALPFKDPFLHFPQKVSRIWKFASLLFFRHIPPPPTLLCLEKNGETRTDFVQRPAALIT